MTNTITQESLNPSKFTENNSETGLISTLSVNIKILFMFLVGFRVQKNVTQSFIFSNVSTQIGVLISENLFL